jgi:transposase
VIIVDAARLVTGGVDTHLDLNVAAALDPIGGLLAVAEFPATSGGHRRLLDWLAGFGPVRRVGVEGTGSYGAGLARYLRAAGVEVVEVDRPNRQARRRAGKSDPLDAIEAARAALSGRACGAAKTRDGNVEAIRALVVAKRSARSVKIKTLNQIRHLSYTAPDQLRERLKGVSRQQLAARAAALRPSQREGADPVMTATKAALRILGRRVLALDEEKARIDALLSGLVTQTAPQPLTLHGVGIDTAATLLVTAGDNPGRLRSEASSAATVSPVRVVVAAIVCTMTSWLVSGRPRQFIEMWLNSRCPILFHLEVPGGKWHTVICRPVWSARAASSVFHSRVR